jgi:hypothetical protein
MGTVYGRLTIKHSIYKSLMETIFESQELRVESEDNVLLRGGVFFAVPCSSEVGCEG